MFLITQNKTFPLFLLIKNMENSSFKHQKYVFGISSVFKVANINLDITDGTCIDRVHWKF